MSSVETRDVLRHVCTRCGGSCQGVQVALLNAMEVERVIAQAGELGVEDPLTDGRLRRVRGRCAFLGDDNLCRIHAKWGLLAKPTVCRQYPLVATRVGEVTRVGIDPGCFTSAQTWRTGPEVPASALVASRSPHPPQVDAPEAHVLALLDAHDAIGPALAALTGADGTWPGAFLTRWVAALQSIRLHELLADEDTSPSLTDSLTPLADGLRAWDANALPTELRLSVEATAFALDASKRMVWLRLCPKLPSPAVVALLSLAGATVCAWSSPEDGRYGQALAGWMRAIRSPAVLGRLVPSPTALQALVEG